MPELIRQIFLTSPMMRGDDIRLVQQRLASLGFTLDQDGLYGQGTRSAVTAYQRREGLQADGIVGRATWTRMFGAPSPNGATRAPPAQADLILDDILSQDVMTRLTAGHSYYMDGVQWSVSRDGLKVGAGAITVDGASSAGAKAVMASFGQSLVTVLARYPVPVELVVACICTESSGNPNAKRCEPGCDTADPERTPTRVSVGLTQTLLSTARSALNQPDLRLSDLATPETSIRAGAAYMWLQSRQTKFDPPLVAAAYNAGSLRYNASPANPWKLVQYPIGTSRHCDRFVKFFNAAMQAMAAAGFPSSLPSLRQKLIAAGH